MTADLPASPLNPFPIVRAGLSLLAAVLVIAAAVYGGCILLRQPEHGIYNLVAAAVCGGAGLLGLLPVWMMSKTSPHGGAMGFLAGILFRMVVAGGAVFYIQWVLKLDHARDLSLWIGVWYLLVLILEVKLISSHALPAPAPGSTPGSLASKASGSGSASQTETN